jgi:AcrR family transcriptional regulator
MLTDTVGTDNMPGLTVPPTGEWEARSMSVGRSKRVALPVVGQPATERADAARNRRTLLAAARTIVATSGVDGLTLDRLAGFAGVGVGTVYRRFGDRAGVAYALLDEEERRFQQGFVCGPPPLGPGAPPTARIRAFLHAYLDRLDVHADLHALAEAQSPTARYHNGAYLTHRMHLTGLLTRICPEGEATYLAEVLLGMLDAGLYLHQRRHLGMSCDQIKAGVDQLLERLRIIGPALSDD